MLSLPTTDEVEAVLDETANDMSTGSLVLDTTTGDPDRRPAVGARLAASGVRYLDAAIVGSSELVRIILRSGESSAEAGIAGGDIKNAISLGAPLAAETGSGTPPTTPATLARDALDLGRIRI